MQWLLNGVILTRKLMYIEWQDHSSFNESGWRVASDYDELKAQYVKSVGFVIMEDSDMIILGQSMNQAEHEQLEDQFTGDICILKNCIKKSKELKL